MLMIHLGNMLTAKFATKDSEMSMMRNTMRSGFMISSRFVRFILAKNAVLQGQDLDSLENHKDSFHGRGETQEELGI